MVEYARYPTLLITMRILHDVVVASRIGNRARDLGVRLHDYFPCCDSGTRPRSCASFIFFVTFFSLPPLECLAGAVDGAVLRELLRASGGGGREGSRAGTGAGRPGAGRPAW
jgi:hypothetical protein